MTNKEQKQLEAKEYLLSNKIITPTTKLLIFIKSTSKSGMMRKMKVLANDQDITFYVNDLLGYNHEKNLDKAEYIKVSGCGMDMTFWLADNITYRLWGNNKPIELTGNGGNCLDWQTVY